MPGWGKLVGGAVLGAVGALYATNEEFRRQLPERARDLPLAVQKRFAAGPRYCASWRRTGETTPAAALRRRSPSRLPPTRQRRCPVKLRVIRKP